MRLNHLECTWSACQIIQAKGSSMRARYVGTGTVRDEKMMRYPLQRER
jgi:hypothetical protein